MPESDEKLFDEPLFFGEYEHTLDVQSRVSFPGEWRKQSGDGAFVMMPARGNALILLPVAIFREFLVRARKMAVANPKVQMAFAMIGAQARQCRCDKQGRMAMERKMLDSIGVANQLKMIGALNHIRLCSPENWNSPGCGDMEAQLDELQKIGECPDELTSLLGSMLGKGAV